MGNSSLCQQRNDESKVTDSKLRLTGELGSKTSESRNNCPTPIFCTLITDQLQLMVNKAEFHRLRGSRHKGLSQNEWVQILTPLFGVPIAFSLSLQLSGGTASSPTNMDTDYHIVTITTLKVHKMPGVNVYLTHVWSCHIFF